jgi:hypothetical protein
MSSRRGGRQNRQQAHQEAASMTGETITAATIMNAPAEAIFAVLADPAGARRDRRHRLGPRIP